MALYIVNIEGLDIFALENAALATRLTIVKTTPSIEHIGTTLLGSGLVNLGRGHSSNFQP